MDTFIPKKKLSKKAKRALAKTQRETWGSLSPVTRKPKNPKAYVREKSRYKPSDDTGVFICLHIDAAPFKIINFPIDNIVNLR